MGEACRGVSYFGHYWLVITIFGVSLSFFIIIIMGITIISFGCSVISNIDINFIEY